MDEAKLKWRCRRGVKEFDVLFGRFVETEYPNLTDEQKGYFHVLLDEQDPVIMDWLFGRSEPEEQGLKWIIGKLKLISGKLE